MTDTMARGKVILVGPDPVEAGVLAEGMRGEDLSLVAAAAPEAGIEAARSAAARLLIVDSRVPDPLKTAGRIRRVNPALGYLLLVGPGEEELAFEAIRRGACDYLIRPVDVRRALLRLRVALERQSRLLEERAYTRILEGRVMQRTEEMLQRRDQLRAQFISTIRALEKALQAKSVYTEGHSRRVAETAVGIARAMGVPPDVIRHVELAALFHDIGKIGIRDEILNKPGGLTDDEYEYIKRHPVVAEQILSPLADLCPIVELVKHEHERWDGRGYPGGLRGDQIPLGARIIAVADAWDSMVFDRVYRRALAAEEALREIRKNAGIMFDPECVRVFCSMQEECLQEASPAG